MTSSEQSNIALESPVPGGSRKLRSINRSQVRWHLLDVERLIEEDHPARAIWELVGRVKLERFLASIASVQGQAGRPAFDPHLLISLWLYAYSRGISSAREIEKRCEYEPPFQWLTGLDVVHHHTLSDFRIEHKEALDELFTQILGVLSCEGMITLERIVHDGTKVYANAGRSSCQSKRRIEAHLEAARQQVTTLEQHKGQDLDARHRKAQQRARREREQKLQRALEEYDKIAAAKPPGYRQASKQKMGVSTSDPEARVMKHSTAGCALSYNVPVSTDTAAGIVVAIDASQTAPDYEHLVPAVRQIEERTSRIPRQIVVDAGYTSRENVLALYERGIEMLGPSIDTDGRVQQRFARCGVKEGFLPKAFQFDPNTNTFLCPEGKPLRPRRAEQRPGRTLVRYQASARDCQICPQRANGCSGNTRYGRSLVVTKEDPVVTAFRTKTASPEGQQALRQRSTVAEFVNAWLKEKLHRFSNEQTLIRYF